MPFSTCWPSSYTRFVCGRRNTGSNVRTGKRDLIDTNLITVTGKTVKENIADAVNKKYTSNT